MKIGIVTLWNTNNNYGGIIQTYALQAFLKSVGYDAFIIRVLYGNDIISKIKSLLKKLLVYTNVIKLTSMYAKLLEVEEKDKLRKFNEFRKNHISLSAFEYHYGILLKLFYPQADCYITGSDQVWAFSPSKPGEFFHYLGFGGKNTKRLSYAASFGHTNFETYDFVSLKRYLKDFNAVSVREISGIDICKKIGIDSIRCVDSTMLLSTKHYESIMSKRKHKEKYAYIYSVNMDNSDVIYWESTKDQLKRKKIKAIVTTASGYELATELFDDVEYDYATPQEWLSNIFHSEIVLTSSFHGIVFSILFKKQFIYYPLKNTNASGNNRIIDLLILLNLENRIADSKIASERLISTEVNYRNVNFNALNSLIKKSKEFLISNIR